MDRVIAADPQGILQSHFTPDGTCDNHDCTTPNSECSLTVTTSAEVEGETCDDWELTVCSRRCLSILLDEPFPLTDAPSRTPSPGSDIRIFEPDV